jgi:hypothetical protein
MDCLVKAVVYSEKNPTALCAVGFSDLKLAHLIYAFEGRTPSLKGGPPDYLT